MGYLIAGDITVLISFRVPFSNLNFSNIRRGQYNCRARNRTPYTSSGILDVRSQMLNFTRVPFYNSGNDPNFALKSSVLVAFAIKVDKMHGRGMGLAQE